MKARGVSIASNGGLMMIRFVCQLAVLSAVAVLFVPGNEIHRDQVLRSFVAAYAHAATYCDRHPSACEEFRATITQVSDDEPLAAL